MNVGHIYRYHNSYGNYDDYVFVYAMSDHTYSQNGRIINTICAMGVNIADSTDIRTIAKESWNKWHKVES